MPKDTTPPEQIDIISPQIDHDSADMLEDIIDVLKKSGASIEAETLILVMLKNLLARIAKENGQEADLNNLTEAQEQQLIEALEEIAEQLQQAGVMGQEEGLKKLIRVLVKSRIKQKEKGKQKAGEEHEQEEDFESLSPKEKERLKKLFKLFAIYEAYKITNPNQIAGETKQENFINNLQMYGKAFAIKKEGSDMGMDAKELDEMERNRKSFVEAITAFKQGKDTGWSR